MEEKILEAARFKLNVDEKVIQAGMFSGKDVDADVRKDYLKQLLDNDGGTDADADVCRLVCYVANKIEWKENGRENCRLKGSCE